MLEEIWVEIKFSQSNKKLDLDYGLKTVLKCYLYMPVWCKCVVFEYQ